MTPGSSKEIPFVDLKSQYLEIRDDIQTAIKEVFDSGWFILGQNAALFEREFADYLGAGYAVGVGSGTDALQISLVACGIGPGDEVITVPNTALPTVAAISCAGAVPVFVDIDPESYTIDVDKIEAKITARTKAIIPVHLYGRMAEIESVKAIASEYGLLVIEDACQAHGAAINGRKAGTFGELGCFSFYPSKNLGGYGDSGMVVTSDASLAERVRLLRNYGEGRRYHHSVKGFNSRMDELQAAVLRVKLTHLEKYNELRKERACDYDLLLRDVGDLVLPAKKNGSHVHHLYVIRTRNRDELQRYLADHQVRTQVHYPIPIHLQEAYLDLGLEEGSYRMAEQASKEILSLPLFPEIKRSEIEQVANLIGKFYQGSYHL